MECVESMQQHDDQLTIRPFVSLEHPTLSKTNLAKQCKRLLRNTRSVPCVFVDISVLEKGVSGQLPEWTPSQMDTIPNGHNSEWIPSRIDPIPNEPHPEWTPSQMNPIPTQSRMSTYLVTEVFYTQAWFIRKQVYISA